MNEGDADVFTRKEKGSIGSLGTRRNPRIYNGQFDSTLEKTFLRGVREVGVLLLYKQTQTTKEKSDMKKKTSNRKLKLGVVTAGIAIICFGGAGLGFYHANKKAQAEENTASQTDKQLTSIQDKQKVVNGWYTDPTKDSLKKETSKQAIDTLIRELDTFKGKELSETTAAKLNTLVSDAYNAGKMAALRDQVAGLLDSKGVLKAKTFVQKTEKLFKTVKKIKPSYAATFEGTLKEAVKQEKRIKQAQKAVQTLFQSDKMEKVKKDVSQKDYAHAKKLVRQIKQKEAKQQLQAKLDQVVPFVKVPKEEASEGTKQAESAPAETSSENQASAAQEGNQQTGSAASGSSTSSYIAPKSANGATSSSNRHSSGSNTYQKPKSGSNGSSSNYSKPAPKKPAAPSHKPSKPSGGNKGKDDMKPGDSWNGTTHDKGDMDSDSGRTWGTIDW